MSPVAEETPPVIEADEVELIDYLEILWSHRWLILLGTVGAMVAAGALTAVTPKSYQASMLVKVGTLFTPGAGEGASLIESPKAVVQILSSDETAQRLQTALGRSDLSLNAIKRAVTAKVVKSDGDAQAPGLVEVTLRLDDPRQVVDGLTFLGDDLTNQHRATYDVALSIIDRSVQALESQLRAHEAERDGLRIQLADLKRRLGSPSSSGGESRGRDMTIAELQQTGWRGQVRDIETRLAAAEQRGAELQQQLVGLAGYRARSDSTRIRTAPILPTVPIAPRVGTIVGLSGMLGVVTTILAAFLIEYVRGVRRRRLLNPSLFTR